MKDKDYVELLEFIPVNGVLIPANSNAVNLMSIIKQGEVQTFSNITKRDRKYHNCYFSLLNFIWVSLPPHFRAKIPCKDFYLFIKMLKGDYDEVFTFKNGNKMIEYKSISFGKMNQAQFEEYVAEQLPIIYDGIIMEMYKPDQANLVIDSIEEQYKVFLSKL